jgi:hypothetical protein
MLMLINVTYVDNLAGKKQLLTFVNEFLTRK